jgi:murein DD-endopeptidase MepM/ murein hydrolase activator NlpD
MNPRTSNPIVLLALLLGLVLAACQSEPAPNDRQPTIERRATNVSVLPSATPAPEPAPTSASVPGATSVPAPTAGPAAAGFFDDSRLFYEPGFYVPEIQLFLDTQPGALKGLIYQVGDRRHTFAEVLVGQTSYYSVNPRVILALLESQSQLISDGAPGSDQIGWAIGFQGDSGNWRGLQGQVRWAVRQLFYARRDYRAYAPLTYADNNSYEPPPGLSLSEYVIARVLAPTTTPDRLPTRMQRFSDAYTELFGDPRSAPQGWPEPGAPFLHRPTEQVVPVTSFFDHDGPFLTRSPAGSVVTYWGRDETDASFAYDGHDGWDYAAAPPDRALAAAAGLVVFAGNADDGCATRAVVIEHGNGYRTLYWHLARVDVEIGQQVAAGEVLGVIGESGCALGPHLHFGTQFLGRGVDPYGWCGAGSDPWETNPAGSRSIWLWVDRPSPCGAPPPDALVVDTDAPSFFRAGDGWQTAPSGYGGSATFVPSIRGTNEREGWRLRPLDPPAVAVWKVAIPRAGRYRVLAYVPYALSGLEDPRATFYRVRHAAGEAQVEINARTYANDWADLGTYEYAAGQEAAVILSNQTEENRLSVWADAIMWIPAE